MDGVTGFLVKPQDPLDLADKVNTLLADPGQAHRMGMAGRDRVLSTFSWRAVADRLEEVYRCLVPPLRSLPYAARPRAANAIQTYSTVTRAAPACARYAAGRAPVAPTSRAPSRTWALHLPRPAVNKLSKFIPWAGWSYIERTLYCYSPRSIVAGVACRRTGYRALYVRDSVCAAWLALLSGVHGARVVYEVHDLESRAPQPRIQVAACVLVALLALARQDRPETLHAAGITDSDLPGLGS